MCPSRRCCHFEDRYTGVVAPDTVRNEPALKAFITRPVERYRPLWNIASDRTAAISSILTPQVDRLPLFQVTGHLSPMTEKV
jgi:hypothetical protein